MAISTPRAQALGVRALAICAALAGCGRPDTPAPHAAAAPVSPVRAAPAPVSPLPDAVTPIAYDLTLELDPSRATFTGRVAITIAVAAPGTTRLWLHAAELELGRAVLRGAAGDEPVQMLDGAPGGAPGSQLRGFVLPHPVGPGPVALVIDYTGRVTDLTGHTGKEEQGLFRERAGGRWYLYSQAESIFARRITPCFDEPRWKPAWRVTAIVPRELVALGNAAVAQDRALPGDRREVRFAEALGLPSYLLAIAVGPFELIDAGRLGRGRIPVRIAVTAGDGRRALGAVRELPGIIDAAERYVGAPLPLAKLDLVEVPEFFGAMENPGLITFSVPALGPGFVEVAAHELAHQWFGDAVTPASWEHLWLSEAFASWLGAKLAGSLAGARPPPGLAHLTRFHALEADDAPEPRALLQPIADASEIEPAFDAIAYDKGAAVLGMFERFAGEAAFQAAVRGYLAAGAGRSVTSGAFLDALGRATRPEIAAALADNLRYAGTPVVELALRCGAAPAIVASVRGGIAVPVCVRFPEPAGPPARLCWLAGRGAEQPLPASAGCPAWLIGNAGGDGYYRTVWRGGAPPAPPPALTPEEQLVRGDDLAFAVRRGERAIGDALADLTALAATGDRHAELAALELAGAIDPLVPDPARPAWTAWLAGRFAGRLTRAALRWPGSVEDRIARAALVALAAGAIDPAITAEARARLERPGLTDRDPVLVRIAAVHDPGAVFDRLVRAAGDAAGDARGDVVEALGELPAAAAPRLVGLLLDRRFPADQVWPALAAMLARGDTRSAAWRAIHGRSGEVWDALPGATARELIAALAALCDLGARAELAADAAPRLAAIPDGRRVLDRTLAAIDRCVARRAAAGDVAAALAAAPPVPSARAGRTGL